jgi:hypothetical protein
VCETAGCPSSALPSAISRCSSATCSERVPAEHVF